MEKANPLKNGGAKPWIFILRRTIRSIRPPGYPIIDHFAFGFWPKGVFFFGLEATILGLWDIS
jgi:hypothetical protein